MNLGILLPLGESLDDYASHGQDVRFIKYYIKPYCVAFDKVYLFSYKTECYSGLPENCELICPKNNFHRYVYGFLLPLLHKDIFRQCDIFRCFHPSAAIPAIVGKLIFGKRFVFNYNYNYKKWAEVEGKSYLVPLLYFQELLAFVFCDGVFVADTKMGEYAKRFVETAKITLIPNGVDPEAFKPDKHKLKQVKNILSVGRLEPQKNYLQLIAAVASIPIPVKLTIVGRGSLQDALVKLAMKLKVRLEIIDMVPNDQLPKVYAQADVYVQPSLMEAPVKTLLEAMSCGLPCVASNVTGIKDLINDGNNGLLAELQAESIAEKIMTILENLKLAETLGRNARETILEKYNLPKIVNLEIEKLKTL